MSNGAKGGTNSAQACWKCTYLLELAQDGISGAVQDLELASDALKILQDELKENKKRYMDRPGYKVGPAARRRWAHTMKLRRVAKKRRH
jgi:hypothetical protein